MEEIVTRDFIIDQHPDALINIVDGTNIERNLYLTLQALELSIPTVVAVNMIDQVEGSGGKIDCDRLSAQLGVPVVPVSAKTGYHIDRVLKTAERLVGTDWKAEDAVRYDSAAQQMLHEVAAVLADFCDDTDRLLFYAGKMVEQDGNILKRLQLPKKAVDEIDKIVSSFLERTNCKDRETVMADIRYRYIEKLVAASVKKPSDSQETNLTDRIDRVLTNRFLAIPIFFLIIFLMFGITFGPVGTFLKGCVDYLFSDEAQQLVANAYLLPGRTDIKCDKRSNLEDIPQITPDWDKMMAEASDDAAKINQICGASNG